MKNLAFILLMAFAGAAGQQHDVVHPFVVYENGKTKSLRHVSVSLVCGNDTISCAKSGGGFRFPTWDKECYIAVQSGARRDWLGPVNFSKIPDNAVITYGFVSDLSNLISIKDEVDLYRVKNSGHTVSIQDRETLKDVSFIIFKSLTHVKDNIYSDRTTGVVSTHRTEK
ncbi:hypothetical protein HYN48_09765 [Flavobacterium magnum]|uniref:Uncharacterized protein n=1 Tax=Flavobacterium magnum TaxID=2162713 RepID=A0A2S0RGV6_9FLAO|nr:hypothetical protein [Flavobacterium magnum]AWA30351.1 hypothetical protein HYN48_09765 [Flavobacterium magnum]